MSLEPELGAPGRTDEVLAKRTRDESTLHASQHVAISRGKGEGASPDGASSSGSKKIVEKENKTDEADLGPIEIVRASTRFEIRIRPDESGLVLLKALDSVTGDIARARNAAVRANLIADGEWLDAHPDFVERWKSGEKKLEFWGERRKSRNKELNPNGVYSYFVMRAAAPGLDTGVIASLQHTDDAEWMGSRFDVLVRCSKSPRFYKPTQPIRVPHRVVQMGLCEDGSANISFRLQSTKVEGATRYGFHLVPRDDWQREELRAITSGDWKLGDAVLSRHPTKRGRWFVRLCYTRLVPRAEGDATVVVRRGVRSFLVAASSTGECRMIYDGGDLVAFNKQMMARRRGLGEGTRRATMGKGATGHGTTRRIDKLIRLSNKEARFKREACKRAARALVLFAKSVGAKEIVYEDFAAPKHEGAYWLIKRWPWHELSLACQSACEAAGMSARAVILWTDRRTCPGCGHVHAEAPVATTLGDRIWECAACGMRRSPDQIDALDMLRVVSGGKAVERVRASGKRIAKAIASADASGKVPEALADSKDSKSTTKSDLLDPLADAEPPRGPQRGRRSRKRV